MPPMSILGLPNELLFHIATFLSKDLDIASFLLANHRLENLLGEYLFQDNLFKNDGSALPLCVKYGLTSGVQKLLKLGAKGDETDPDCRTAWSYAAEYGDFEIWQMLLEHQVSLGLQRHIDKEDGYSYRTPLSWAAGGGQLEFAQYLIDSGADVNAKCLGHRTPLSYAAQSGYFTMVQCLLDQGADLGDPIDLEDGGGLTPLHYAAFEGQEEIMRLLISLGADVDCMQGDRMGMKGPTPLMEAARGGQYAVVKMLLKMGADVNKGDGRGMSPLQYAARAGVGEPIRDGRYLLTNSMSDQRGPGCFFDKMGYQALHKTGKPGDYLTIVKLLVAHGADPNELHDDYDGYSQGGPLYCAAWVGATEIVDFLIDVGADVNGTYAMSNCTVLDAAVRNGHLEVVEKLLANGAVDARNLGKHTPLDRAKVRCDIVNKGKHSLDYGDEWCRSGNLHKYQHHKRQQEDHMLITPGDEVGREDALSIW
ncbi:hypothetical protein N7451_003379 [Penicillium sp. IBT 35674x]|nr:hypothetical protein N7451_003379 [Penicillium sp. IBT 35674x]